MNERIMQFRVGVVVLSAVLFTGFLILFFSNTSSMWMGKYDIYIRFKEAPGVSASTPVRKSGIRIGRVKSVQFSDDDRAVIVTAEIDAGRTVYHDEVPMVVSSLLMGDAAIEFERPTPSPNPPPAAPDPPPAAPDPPPGPRTPVEPGETLQGGVAEDPTRAIANLQQNLGQTMGSVNDASKEIQLVLGRIDHLLALNDERITRILEETDDTLKVMNRSLNHADDILGDAKVREEFKQSMDRLPKTLDKLDASAQAVRDSAKSLQDNLENLEGITGPLGKRGADIVGRIDSSTEKLNTVLDNLKQFSNDLNTSDGTLAHLVHDPELYRRINRAACNIDQLTRELQPVIDNARVFSDKIARHPESLGVRGALERNPGIK